MKKYTVYNTTVGELLAALRDTHKGVQPVHRLENFKVFEADSGEEYYYSNSDVVTFESDLEDVKRKGR
jgi:hypothetical protein